MEKRNLEALRREHKSKFNKVQPKRSGIKHSVSQSKKSEEEKSQVLAQSQMIEKKVVEKIENIESNESSSNPVINVSDKDSGAQFSYKDVSETPDGLRTETEIKRVSTAESDDFLHLRERELSRLIFALESLKSKKKESLYFKDETSRPDSELVSEAEEYELRPRFSAEELAKKEENEAFWKENSESSSDSSMGWKLMWAFFMLLIGLGAAGLVSNPSSKTNNIYNDSFDIYQGGTSSNSERDLTSTNRSELIAGEEYQFHITYDDIALLFADFKGTASRLTADEVVAKLGKAKSGREHNYDNQIITLNLDYPDAGSNASVSISFSSYGSVGTPKLDSLFSHHLSSNSLPNRNSQLTRQDFSGIEKGKSYQEVVGQLGLPDSLSIYTNYISSSKVSISYQLSDGQIVHLSFEISDSQDYILEKSPDLEDGAGETNT